MSESLAAMSNEPQEITVGGRTWKCGAWTMGDYAKVEATIRSERLDTLITQSRHVRMMQDPEILAAAIGHVQNATIGLREMLTSQRSRLELLFINLSRNDPAVSKGDVEALPPIDARTLYDLMSTLSGLDDKTDDADPTTATSSTQAEEGT